MLKQKVSKFLLDYFKDCVGCACDNGSFDDDGDYQDPKDYARECTQEIADDVEAFLNDEWQWCPEDEELANADHAELVKEFKAELKKLGYQVK